MPKARRLMLAITALFLTNCASGDQAPFSSEQPVVRDPAIIAQRLQAAVQSTDRLDIKTIGQICYDKFTVPIWLLQLTNKAPNAPKVLITAGVHGNEPAGVESAVRLAEPLARDPDTYRKFAFEIIPMVNPWGWSRDLRFKQQGIDINRDFVSLASQEARIISGYLQRKQYHLIVDLHEDPAQVNERPHERCQRPQAGLAALALAFF